MNLQIILLGLIQGVTEFLPISSSGHLVLLQKIFGLKEMLFYDVLLHFSTLLAVVVLFFKDIVEYLKNKKIIFYILLLSVPTGIIGLVVKKYFTSVYDNVFLSGIFLVITGLWLIFSEKKYLSNFSDKIDILNIGIIKSLLVGITQGISVLPGISRSAATLGSMLVLNFKKEQAVKFIFIASIPAILGATFLELKDIIFYKKLNFELSYIYGIITAFVFALISLKFLVKIVQKSKLKYFGYYCFLVSIVSVITHFFKK
ncbi:MAG: undecaprenyl-diphosphate phosphatase [Endomicrobiia bacterium]